MPLAASFGCDLCDATANTLMLGSPGGEAIKLPPDWMMLLACTEDLVLPPHLDAAAAAADPEDGPAFEAEMEPFRTSIYVCPACRPTLSVIDDLVRTRFKERDEVEPQPTPPSGDRVIDLNAHKKK